MGTAARPGIHIGANVPDGHDTIVRAQKQENRTAGRKPHKKDKPPSAGKRVLKMKMAGRANEAMNG